MQKIINLIGYFLYYISNFILITQIPDKILNNFLSIYSLSSVIFGIFIFLIFTKFILFLKLGLFLSIIFINFFLLFKLNNYIFYLYTFLIILIDYLTTQSLGSIKNFLFRSLFFIFSLLLFFKIINFDFYIYLRIIYILLIIVFVLSQNKKIKKINVKYPFIYLLVTHLFYFVPLYLLTIYFFDIELKKTYIFTQVMLSLFLKFNDYNMRYSDNLLKYKKFLYLLLFFVPLFFNFKEIFYIIYYISLIILISFSNICINVKKV